MRRGYTTTRHGARQPLSTTRISTDRFCPTGLPMPTSTPRIPTTQVHPRRDPSDMPSQPATAARLVIATTPPNPPAPLRATTTPPSPARLIAVTTTPVHPSHLPPVHRRRANATPRPPSPTALVLPHRPMPGRSFPTTQPCTRLRRFSAARPDKPSQRRAQPKRPPTPAPLHSVLASPDIPNHPVPTRLIGADHVRL